MIFVSLNSYVLYKYKKNLAENLENECKQPGTTNIVEVSSLINYR